jgi:hypothetical protein
MHRVALMSGLVAALLTQRVLALDIVQEPAELPKAKSGIWPPRSYVLAVPADKDLCFISGDRTLCFDYLDLGQSKSTTYSNYDDQREVPQSVTLQFCGKETSPELKLAAAGSRVPLKDFGVPLEKIQNKSASVVAINYHVMSDLNDVILFVQDGQRVHCIFGLLDHIRPQFVAKGIKRETELDHIYLEVRKIVGHRIKCNVSGNAQGEIKYGANALFWVEMRRTQSGLRFVVCERAKPEKGERRSRLIVSPFTNQIL